MVSSRDLHGRVAVVTGASSGIGRATAIALASAGADVLIHARERQDKLERTARAILRFRQQARIFLGDLASPTDRAALIEHAFAWQQRVDCWVNNAGVDVLTGQRQHASFEQKMEWLWSVDVCATVALTRTVAARMQMQRQVQRFRPCIVNMGWDQAEHGMEGDSGQLFATIKGAVAAFTRSAAKSYAPQVRILGVAPGWIRTAWGATASECWQQRAKQSSLSGRWGRPTDVARMIAFLCSRDADFVDGQMIPVNGGWRSDPHHA